MYILVSDFMALRPGRCYNKITKRPWTRVSKRKPRKSYVKGVPAPKIHHYETGDRRGTFKIKKQLISKKDVQIRSNALESCRVAATKHLSTKLGDKGFFFKVHVFPHHVLRENAMATGAGADRFSQGMRKSFGKPKGQSARVREGQVVLTAKGNAGSEKALKEALKRASAKLAGTYRIK